MRAVLLLIIVLLVLVATFALQNPGYQTVRFFHLTGSTSLLVIVVVAFGVGLLAGILVEMPSAFRRRREIRELKAQVASLRKTAPPAPPVTP